MEDCGLGVGRFGLGIGILAHLDIGWVILPYSICTQRGVIKGLVYLLLFPAAFFMLG